MSSAILPANIFAEQSPARSPSWAHLVLQPPAGWVLGVQQARASRHAQSDPQSHSSPALTCITDMRLTIRLSSVNYVHWRLLRPQLLSNLRRIISKLIRITCLHQSQIRLSVITCLLLKRQASQIQEETTCLIVQLAKILSDLVPTKMSTAVLTTPSPQ